MSVTESTTETTIMHAMIDFTGKRVLEIGCGDGRVTWQYAQQAASVVAIDPDKEAIRRAIDCCPAELCSTVTLLHSDIEQYAVAQDDPGFDLVFFTRSLC